MTNPDPMTRDELIELAPLDAFGLLDDVEAAMFHRSFHHAPASVQAEIRAIQAELVQSAAFLSSEDPRAILRQKVLLRISEEVEEIAEQLRPLAQIGGLGGVPTVVGAVSGPVGAADRSSPVVFAGRGDRRDELGAVHHDAGASQDDAMRELVAEIRARSSLAVKDRATPYWRAAAFFLAAGLVVSLYFLARTMRTAEAVAQLAQNQVINAQLAAFVPNLADFAYRDSDIRGLTSADAGVNAAATLYLDAEHNRALLLTLGLSECNGPFTLRSVDDRGNATVLLTFQTNDPVHGRVAENLPAEVFAQKLELLDGDGKVILRTA